MRKEVIPPMKPPKPHEIGVDKQVSMSNALVRASHGLLLSEKRLIMLGIGKTDQLLPVEGNSGWIVTVHASEYAKQFDIDVDSAYRQLKRAAERLFSRYVRGIWWLKGSSRMTSEIYFRWVSSAEYLSSEGTVVLNFSPEVVPHLIELKREFTRYKLTTSCLFESIYAWRLYELLLSYVSQQNTKELTILEFKGLMDTPPSLSKNFGLLRVNAIEPAVKQINEKSDMSVSWTAIKKGRKYDKIIFEFSMDEQLKMKLPEPKRAKTYTRADLEKDNSLAKAGESYEQALKRLNSSRN